MFIFISCQVGFERILREEVGELYQFNGAFSLPGFVTFKTPDDLKSHESIRKIISDIANRSIFARTVSISLGKLSSDDLVKSVWRLVSQSQYFINRIHVFCRDRFVPGQHGFEPCVPVELKELHGCLTASSPFPKFLSSDAGQFNQPAICGETVLDVVRIEDDLYFAGVHFVTDDAPVHVCYSGGIVPIQLPANAASRAWLKFEEGLWWSKFQIGKNSCCLDIGAAPGGGSQVLLSRGANVIGIDPAKIAENVLAHPNFKHIRGRINQTKRSLYKNAQWIIADINAAPKYTLDVLDDIAKYNQNINGMLFTLKLPQLNLIKQIPNFIKQIKKWGFKNIKTKQLVFNKQEIMIAAK
ncbi:MAG: hypothetical protein LBP59_09005 [Planctomycetaceae bacterium]|jgi:23S rRNA C2498 (ribose-2'-O)-methylase RlmM|nr:hypothetical protein [Planctomycetaceae bacterium]